MANGYVVAGILAGVGLVLTVVGCVLIPVFDGIVEDTIIESAQYVNGSDGYDNFQNSSSPTYTYFYFFNLTNADAVLNTGATPKVEEIGPYVYRTVRPKNSLQFQEYDMKISFRSNTTYLFESELSQGNDPYNDRVTNVNLILLVAAKSVDGIAFAGDELEGLIDLNNETVFDTFIIDDYLWGYNETTMLQSSIELLSSAAESGLFYGSNESQSSETVVYTGVENINRINEMYTWKGLEYASYQPLTGSPLPVWNSPTANMLNGTDGTQYRPFLEKDTLLYTFSTDICRSLKMLYDSEQDVYALKSFRFVLDPVNFAVNDENIGFCVPDETNCFPEGFLNVENCYEGTPLVASLPHWYLVDEAEMSKIEGLNPQKEIHETAIDVEPNTGISVRGNKRLQINYYLEELQYFPGTEADMFKDGFIFPIFWLNEFSEITPEDADAFKSDVIDNIELLEIIQYTVIGVGAFVALVGLVLLAYFRCTKGRKDWD